MKGAAEAAGKELTRQQALTLAAGAGLPAAPAAGGVGDLAQAVGVQQPLAHAQAAPAAGGVAIQQPPPKAAPAGGGVGGTQPAKRKPPRPKSETEEESDELEEESEEMGDSDDNSDQEEAEPPRAQQKGSGKRKRVESSDEEESDHDGDLLPDDGEIIAFKEKEGTQLFYLGRKLLPADAPEGDTDVSVWFMNNDRTNNDPYKRKYFMAWRDSDNKDKHANQRPPGSFEELTTVVDATDVICGGLELTAQHVLTAPAQRAIKTALGASQ